MDKLNESTKEKAVRQITDQIMALYGTIPSFVDPVGLREYIQKSTSEKYDEKMDEIEGEELRSLDMSWRAKILPVPGELVFRKSTKGNWNL
jgi:hypothetical protein